jgi:hypothetical protein
MTGLGRVIPVFETERSEARKTGAHSAKRQKRATIQDQAPAGCTS